MATATPAPTTLAVELTTTDLWLLVAIGVLLICSLLLAVAETALVRVPRPRAEDLAAERRKGADALVELLSRPEQFVTTVVFLLLGCQLVQATLVGIVADRMLGVVGLILATAVNVVVVFVVAETAPKTWAVLNPERAALAAAGPVRRLALFPPLRLATRALIGLANLVLPGRGLQQGPFVSSEEELLAMAEASVEEGVIEEDERALIESIIEFGDTVVREVMVPRPDMVTVPAGFRVADVMEVLLLNGYSRLPVCSGTLDDVVGLAYAKDLMAAERDGNGDAPVSSQMRPARFVPETKRVPEMLREMQRDKFHMAIVVDEYGGTAGLVTLEDIIEELVGEIVDEFDVDDPLVEPLPGGGIRVHARTSLDEVNDLLHTRFPEGDWDTIGGLLYDRIGHAPTEGESVTIGGWRLTAQRIQGRRIGRVRITPDSPAPPSPGPPAAGIVGVAAVEAIPARIVGVAAFGAIPARIVGAVAFGAIPARIVGARRAVVCLTRLRPARAPVIRLRRTRVRPAWRRQTRGTLARVAPRPIACRTTYLVASGARGRRRGPGWTAHLARANPARRRCGPGRRHRGDPLRDPDLRRRRPPDRQRLGGRRRQVRGGRRRP